MSNLLTYGKRVYTMYAVNVALLLPMILVTCVGLFLNKIPYLNLFKDTIMTLILIFDWFAVLWLSRIKTSTMMILGLIIFVATIPLELLKLHWYVESLANLCYIIFTTAVVFELLKHTNSKK